MRLSKSLTPFVVATALATLLVPAAALGAPEDAAAARDARAATSAGSSTTSIPGPSGRISACYAIATGHLRVVDSTEPSCTPDVEQYISWNQSRAGDLACAGCVGTPDIASRAVTGAKIAEGAIAEAHLGFAVGSEADLDALKTSLRTADAAVNDASDPVHWTRLAGVPDAFADGRDDDASYTAGSGLTLSGSIFSADLGASGGDGGSATSIARSDHLHDARYYTEMELSSVGSINAATNPVDWSKLKNVPAGFADGVDDNAETATDLACTGCVGSADIENAVVATTHLAFDPATQAELDAHKTSTDHDARYIINQGATPQKGELFLDGQIRTSNLIRLGAEDVGETPTTGLVIRRVNSTTATAGAAVARERSLRFERDGTFGGFRIAWPGDQSQSSVSCTGVTSAGTPVGKYLTVATGAAASSASVFTNAQNVVQFTCQFGNTFNADHSTTLTLHRELGDWYWLGTLISTVNQ